MIDLLPTILPIISGFTIITMMVNTMVDGQINRYINPAWLEMDANSEYYPGGEVISQILRAYGLGDAPYDGFPRYRSLSSAVIDRNGYGTRSYPRSRVMGNNLNSAYDSDPLALEILDGNYDYADNAIRDSSYRYRNGAYNVPRRNRMNAMIASPRTAYYYPSDYVDLSSRPYAAATRSRQATGDPAMVVSQELGLRNREIARLVPRSTVAPNTSEQRQASN